MFPWTRQNWRSESSGLAPNCCLRSRASSPCLAQLLPIGRSLWDGPLKPTLAWRKFRSGNFLQISWHECKWTDWRNQTTSLRYLCHRCSYQVMVFRSYRIVFQIFKLICLWAMKASEVRRKCHEVLFPWRIAVSCLSRRHSFLDPQSIWPKSRKYEQYSSPSRGWRLRNSSIGNQHHLLCHQFKPLAHILPLRSNLSRFMLSW